MKRVLTTKINTILCFSLIRNPGWVYLDVMYNVYIEGFCAIASLIAWEMWSNSGLTSRELKSLRNSAKFLSANNAIFLDWNFRNRFLISLYSPYMLYITQSLEVRSYGKSLLMAYNLFLSSILIKSHSFSSVHRLFGAKEEILWYTLY